MIFKKKLIKKDRRWFDDTIIIIIKVGMLTNGLARAAPYKIAGFLLARFQNSGLLENGW